MGFFPSPTGEKKRNSKRPKNLQKQKKGYHSKTERVHPNQAQPLYRYIIPRHRRIFKAFNTEKINSTPKYSTKFFSAKKLLKKISYSTLIPSTLFPKHGCTDLFFFFFFFLTVFFPLSKDFHFSYLTGFCFYRG